MLDFTRTWYQNAREYPLSGTISEEGSAMYYLNDGSGNISVAVSTAAGDLTEFFGVAITDKLGIATFPYIGTGTVPAAPGPYTITTPKTNIIFASVRCYDNTAVGAVTPVLAPAVPAPGEVSVNIVNAVMTFNAAGARAGHSITFWYTYVPTVDEILSIRPGQRAVGNYAQDYYGSIVVTAGRCEVYTTMYDTASVWVQPGFATLGLGGRLFQAAAPIAGDPAIRVIKTPSASDLYLGVQFTI